jgi:hypothetical protein
MAATSAARTISLLSGLWLFWCLVTTASTPSTDDNARRPPCRQLRARRPPTPCTATSLPPTSCTATPDVVHGDLIGGGTDANAVMMAASRAPRLQLLLQVQPPTRRVRSRNLTLYSKAAGPAGHQRNEPPGGGSCTEKTGGVLLSRALASQVPSALRGCSEWEEVFPPRQSHRKMTETSLPGPSKLHSATAGIDRRAPQG